MLQQQVLNYSARFLPKIVISLATSGLCSVHEGFFWPTAAGSTVSKLIWKFKINFKFVTRIFISVTEKISHLCYAKYLLANRFTSFRQGVGEGRGTQLAAAGPRVVPSCLRWLLSVFEWHTRLDVVSFVSYLLRKFWWWIFRTWWFQSLRKYWPAILFSVLLEFLH